MKTAIKRISGFTLIELLIVIGILAILLAIVLIALNPARQFSQANNTARRNDVNALLNAVHQYSADNRGNIAPLGITTTVTNISSSGINLCDLLVTEYLAALPVDPLTNNGAPVQEADCAGAYDTNYTIFQSAANSRITIAAPAAELSEVISVTR